MTKLHEDPAAYCAKCNAPKKWPDYILRCSACAVINGKLPPTKFQPTEPQQQKEKRND
jgi:hypothetical protein